MTILRSWPLPPGTSCVRTAPDSDATKRYFRISCRQSRMSDGDPGKRNEGLIIVWINGARSSVWTLFDSRRQYDNGLLILCLGCCSLAREDWKSRLFLWSLSMDTQGTTTQSYPNRTVLRRYHVSAATLIFFAFEIG